MTSTATPKTTSQCFLEYLLVFLFFSVVTFFMLYPLTFFPGNTQFPMEDEFLTAWIISWDLHKLVSIHWAGFFDGNIFWPYSLTLAYSEHQIGSAILAAPVLLPTGNSILAKNFVRFLSFSLGGVGMYALIRHFRLSRSSALIGGIINAFCLWRFGHIGHQSLLASQWMPFSLLYMHRVVKTGLWKDALLCGLFFTLQALSGFYLAMFLTTAMVVVFIYELKLHKWRLSRKTWFRLALAGVLSALILLPTIIPYFRLHKEMGFERNEEINRVASADPMDYFAAPPTSKVWGFTAEVFKSRLTPYTNENWLFPGLTVLLLVAVGFFNRKAPSDVDRRFQKIYFALAIIVFVISLGPQLHVFWRMTPILLPYKLFYHIVPGFKAMRVSARFNSLTMLALSILAGYGFHNIENKIKVFGSRIAVFTLICAGILAESFSVPIPNIKVPTGSSIPPVYGWLKSKPADAVVAELPQYLTSETAPKGLDSPLGSIYMYYSSFHNYQPTINGYSAFYPPTRWEYWTTLRGFPSAESIHLLRYLRVQYVVVHADRYPGNEGYEAAAKADKYGNDIIPEATFGTDKVYRIAETVPAKVRGK